MKPIYRCEYCNEMGTEDYIREHEEKCLYNYNKKSCLTCKHVERDKINYKCKVEKDIPKGQYYLNCDKYEFDEKSHSALNPIPYNNIFGSFL